MPEFRAAFDEIRTLAHERCGVDLGPVIVPVPAGPDADDWYADTVHQQLGLFALGLSFGRQLAAWGITPHAMLGNSIGEYAAAALAGTWSLPDAVGLVHRRAVAMRDASPAGWPSSRPPRTRSRPGCPRTRTSPSRCAATARRSSRAPRPP
ncbi:acyltransferase domain-containing protein [Streptomyces diastatochromogenes]|nr:acyltransferase domain-containing protein [Streptomyces diastatochromogenes]